MNVSVVIPSYCHERYIGEAVASALQQDEVTEVILIDDCSTDGTLREIERYHFARTPRFQIHVNKHNQGAARTINRGVAMTRSPLVAILNSDDCYHPQRFKQMLPMFPRADIAFSGVKVVDATGRDQTQRAQRWQHDFDLMFKAPHPLYVLMWDNVAVSTGNLIFKREFFDKLGGFRVNRPVCHDYDFVLRAALHGTMAAHSAALYFYRLHGKNTVLADQYQNDKDTMGVREDFLRTLSEHSLGKNEAFMRHVMALYGKREWVVD